MQSHGKFVLRKMVETVATKRHILKAKMHQIRFRLGLRPRPLWVAYSDSPDLLTKFKEPTSEGREGGRTGR